MEFGYTPEQLEFKERIHKFAAEQIRPVAMKHDKDQSVPWDVMKAAAKEGIGTLDFMMSLGSDPQGQFSAIYAEEMHWGCAGIALAAVAAASILGLGLVSWLTLSIMVAISGQSEAFAVGLLDDNGRREARRVEIGDAVAQRERIVVAGVDAGRSGRPAWQTARHWRSLVQNRWCSGLLAGRRG